MARHPVSTVAGGATTAVLAHQDNHQLVAVGVEVFTVFRLLGTRLMGTTVRRIPTLASTSSGGAARGRKREGRRAAGVASGMGTMAVLQAECPAEEERAGERGTRGGTISKATNQSEGAFVLCV